jgi:hypothetical protein
MVDSYEPGGEHGAKSVHAVPHGLRPRGTLSSAAETGVAAILTAGSVSVSTGRFASFATAALALWQGCATLQTTAVPDALTGYASPQATVQVVSGDVVLPGTRLITRLDQGLSAQDSHPGKVFTATVVSPVTDPNGRPIIPSGAQVRGHVLDLRRRTGSQPALLVLEFDTLRVAGVTRPLRAALVQTPLRPQDRERGPDVVLGASDGSTVGAIFGRGRSAPLGGSVGISSASLVSLGVADGAQDSLPAGSTLVLQTRTGLVIIGLTGPYARPTAGYGGGPGDDP